MALPFASTGSSYGILTGSSYWQSHGIRVRDFLWKTYLITMDILNGIIKSFAHRLLWIGVKLLSSEAPDCPTGNDTFINLEDSLRHLISFIIHWSKNTTKLLLLKWKFELAFLSEVTPVLPYKLAYVRYISLSTMCGNCRSVPIQLKQSTGSNIMNILPTLCAIIPKYHGTVSTLYFFSDWLIEHTNIKLSSVIPLGVLL